MSVGIAVVIWTLSVPLAFWAAIELWMTDFETVTIGDAVFFGFLALFSGPVGLALMTVLLLVVKIDAKFTKPLWSRKRPRS